MQPIQSRREFLGAIATAFATAGIACTVPKGLFEQQRISAVPKLLPGTYNAIITTVDYNCVEMRLIQHLNNVRFGKFGQGAI